jgi:hypothetical protein
MRSSASSSAGFPTELVILTDDEMTKVAGGQATLTITTPSGQVSFTTPATLSVLTAGLGATVLAALESGVRFGVPGSGARTGSGPVGTAKLVVTA